MTSAVRIERPVEWAQDIALACLLVFVGLVGTGPASADQVDWTQRPDGLAYTLVVLAGLPLVARRRYPVPVLVASAAAVLFYLAENYAFGPIMLTVPLLAYTLGAHRPLRHAVPWVAGYYVAMYVVVLPHFLNEPAEYVWRGVMGWTIGALAAFAGSLAVGAAIRVRQESAAGVRAEQARRAISEERLRMAQELHDTVGHGLAVIAMQAGVALHVLERNPAKVREALEAIQATSRESLDGLRAELAVWRAPDGNDAPRRPGVGVADVDVLFDRIRTGGIRVEADVDPPAMSPETDVVVYRILQESLTNVLRHAGASTAWVRVRRDGDHVMVDVVDDGAGHHHGAGAVAQGSGILGMRARAGSLGGELDAGPRPEGGFAVRARLPLRPAPAASGVSGSTS